MIANAWLEVECRLKVRGNERGGGLSTEESVVRVGRYEVAMSCN
jgi:hypothetical protein